MHVDVAVIGGGIAGLSCAAYLAPRTSVAVIETETTLGYHTTGRSAALYTECYGTEPIRRITLASKAYFLDRDEPLGTPRSLLFVAPPGDADVLQEFYEMFSSLVDDLEILTAEEVSEMVEAIAPEMTAGAILEPGALDLDVHGILTSFAATVRSNDGSILTGAEATEFRRVESGWRVRAGDHIITANIVVNASGAWGDHVAALAGVDAVGLTPLKRSAFTFDPGFSTREWPMVVDTGEQWYIKPEGPHLLGSAASEIPEEPGDARHDEIDIALGIERINEATTLAIRSVKNQWAGLRTFTSDRVPVVGFDARVTDFFWLVGQGGYGIHTSPGMGAMSAGLILEGRVPDDVANYGVTAEMFDPFRLR